VARAGRCSLAAQIPLNHAALTAFPKLGVTARPVDEFGRPLPGQLPGLRARGQRRGAGAVEAAGRRRVAELPPITVVVTEHRAHRFALPLLQAQDSGNPKPCTATLLSV
jgi:hypothetical protein